MLYVLSLAPSEAATYVVDRATDTNPTGDGEGSNLTGDLRFALVNAQAGDGIVIQVAGTVALAAALPPLGRDICIKGPGAKLLTVDGVGGSVFSVSPGVTVALAGLTISGGTGNGGGILNRGTLTVSNAVIRGNTAGDPTNGNGTGAGIWNYVGANLTLNNSTITGNNVVGNLSYAPSRGGGIANDGTMVLNNSTVSGNGAAQGFGGGISNALPMSTLTLNHSTISSNSSMETTGNGGIDNRGVLVAGGSIVAGNADGDLSGGVISQGFNLIGSTNGSGFVASDLLGVDALLGPLQDNGGATPTMAPLVGSPAVDRIDGVPGVDYPATDQRGIARPQGIRADSGAVEAEATAPSMAGLQPRETAQTAARGSVILVDSATRPVPRALSSRGSNNPCSPD